MPSSRWGSLRSPVTYETIGEGIGYKWFYNLLGFQLKWFCDLHMISYDESKRIKNIADHGFDFVGADEIFAGHTVCREDARDAWRDAVTVDWPVERGSGVCSVHRSRRYRSHHFDQKGRKT